MRGRGGLAAHHLGLDGVQPAAEGQRLDRHQAAPMRTGRGRGAPRPRGDRAGHQHVVVGAPLHEQVSAGQAHRGLPADHPQARGRHHGGAGGGAAGERQPGAPLPDAELDRLARRDLRDRDVGALREDRMVLQHRADLREIEAVRVASAKNTACGLPMFTAPGECRIGSSIGPICSSIRRVSGKGSRRGISFQASPAGPCRR